VVDPQESAWASELGALSHLDSFQVDDMACKEWCDTLPQVIVNGASAVKSFTTALTVSAAVHEAMVARFLSFCYAWEPQRYENSMQATASPVSAVGAPQFAPTQVAGARDAPSVTLRSTFAMDLRKLPWVPIDPHGGDRSYASRARSQPKGDDAVSRTASGASRTQSGEGGPSLTVSVAKYTFVPTEMLKRHFGPLVNFLSADVYDRVRAMLESEKQWSPIEKHLGLRCWRDADGRQSLAMMTINVLNEWSEKSPEEVPMLSIAHMETMCVVGAVLHTCLPCACVRVTHM
jgi:hypothetical protein